MDRSGQGLFSPRAELKTKGEKESRSPFVLRSSDLYAKNQKDLSRINGQ
ncbi:hypothetical protein BTH41_04651 [Bacillus mycoides]|nr:hypothetical protein BTH41_04651 [Bacillus mycoides]